LDVADSIDVEMSSVLFHSTGYTLLYNNLVLLGL